MNNYYFKYNISKATDPKNPINDGFIFLIERFYNDGRYEYKLNFIIKRKKSSSRGDNHLDLPITDETFYGKYLFIAHSKNKNKIQKPIHAISSLSKDEFYVKVVNVSDENDATGMPLNDQYYYIKCTLNDLREEDITGTGVFGFSDNMNEEPSADHRFFYYCLFQRKTRVPYRIDKTGNKLKITLPNFPDISSDISFSIAYSNVPIYQITNILSDNFVFKSSKKRNRKLKKTIILDDKNVAECKYFRLVINEKELQPLFKLYNEGNTNEVSKDSIDEKNTRTNNKLCPYCFGPLVSIDTAKLVNVPISCQGEKPFSKPLIFNDKTQYNTIYCDNYYDKESLKNSKLKPPKRMEIPLELISKNSKNTFVSVLGLPASGKSVFLSCLLGLQSGKSSDLTYLNSFLKPFHLEFNLRQGFFVIDDIIGSNGQIIPNKNYYSAQTYGSKIQNNDEELIYKDFAITSKSQIYRTDEGTNFYPFILQSNPNGTNLILRDIAGEDARSMSFNVDKQTERVLKSDAHMIFVSPNDQDFKELFEKIIHDSNKNKPIAVVLTKFDLICHEFDENCACLVDSTYDLINLSTYRDSYLQKNIDQASMEIRSYIKDNMPALDIKLAEVEQKFKRIKYFAISSLGNEECSTFIDNQSNDDKDNKEKKLYRNIVFCVKPFRIELPILWILYHTGIIG